MPLTTLNQLLHLLADGKFHSGTDLGHSLQISRSAVWKQLCGVESLGLSVNRVRGKGYRIPLGLDLLDIEAILRFQPSFAKCFSLQLLMSAESTNGILMGRIANGVAIHGQVVLAEVQTAGRGRMGRPWHAPFAQQLAMSVGWQFPSIKALEGLSLVVGLAVVDALQSLGVENLAVKWPNDILLNNKKLSGILLELSGDATGPCQVVIGIGLNVHLMGDAEIDQPWTSLLYNGYQVSRNKLTAKLLNSLQRYLTIFSAQGFAHFREPWQACHVYQNRWVTLTGFQGIRKGLCLGVDDSGALRVDIDGKLHRFSGGEVSLKAVANGTAEQKS